MKKIAKYKRLSRIILLAILALAISLVKIIVQIKHRTVVQRDFEMHLHRLVLEVSWDSYGLMVVILLMMLLLLFARDVIKSRLDRAKKDLPDVLQEPIDANHGDTLDEVILNLRDEKVEFLAIFYQCGAKVIEQTEFSPNSVYTKLSDQEGMMTIHNHPPLGIHPFSMPDLANIAYYNRYKSMVLDQRFLYVMTNHCYGLGMDETCADDINSFIKQLYAGRKCEKLWQFGQLSGLYRLYMNWRVAKEFGYEFRVKSLWLLQLRKQLSSFRGIAKFGMAVTAIVLALVLPREFAYTTNLSYRYVRTTTMPTTVESFQAEKEFVKNREADYFSELAEASTGDVSPELKANYVSTKESGYNRDDSANWNATVGGGKNISSHEKVSLQDIATEVARGSVESF